MNSRPLYREELPSTITQNFNQAPAQCFIASRPATFVLFFAIKVDVERLRSRSRRLCKKRFVQKFAIVIEFNYRSNDVIVGVGVDVVGKGPFTRDNRNCLLCCKMYSTTICLVFWPSRPVPNRLSRDHCILGQAFITLSPPFLMRLITENFFCIKQMIQL